MNPFNEHGISTTQREFVSKVDFGTAGIAGISAGSVQSGSAAVTQSGKRMYGKWIKRLSFEEWQEPYRQVTRHTSEFADLHIEYGSPAVAGRLGSNTSEIHDFNQVMIFMGSDPTNIGDLGAHIELCMGPEREKHMITTSTAVFIPKGLPHMPPTAVRMDRRFIIMTISQTSAPKSTPAPKAEKEL